MILVCMMMMMMMLICSLYHFIYWVLETKMGIDPLQVESILALSCSCIHSPKRAAYTCQGFWDGDLIWVIAWCVFEDLVKEQRVSS